MAKIISFPGMRYPRNELDADRQQARAELRQLTLNEVRTLWDTADGVQSDGYLIEDIHAELNRRGDGVYCAV